MLESGMVQGMGPPRASRKLNAKADGIIVALDFGAAWLTVTAV